MFTVAGKCVAYDGKSLLLDCQRKLKQFALFIFIISYMKIKKIYLIKFIKFPFSLLDSH